MRMTTDRSIEICQTQTYCTLCTMWNFCNTYTFVCTNLYRISRELQKEARMCILQHVNIVALLAIILEIGHCGIVMEYILHGSLNEFMLEYDVWFVNPSVALGSKMPLICLLDPEGSLSATTVVLLLVLVVVVTRFWKMPKASLICNGKLRNLAYTFVTSFPTDLPS